ncbi:MAG: UDP-glucose/GDP-mannose dehydrogenase family protein, partial [Deltaproteobacteria bacterium]|nr:UDP-glucose/GDP-mannose dehydrogenase family protein [Deltaproteobacteria bacterium]
VGLVVGCCLAEFGNDVCCVDREEQKIAMLRQGSVPFFEPGLEPLLARNQQGGRLTFSVDLTAAVRRAEIIFIAVGTPAGGDGAADLRQVLEVARGIGQAIDADGKIVSLKSTVPVGTADLVREAIAARTSHSFDVVSNPEFLKEGNAVNDFLKPDRVVVGTLDARSREVMLDLYAPCMRTRERLIFMDNRSAEMTKYTANALLACRISFMNEVANLCERVGADVDLVRHGVGSDTRIGHQFLFPGVGYGGSCFPKDVDALISTAKEHGTQLCVLEAVAEVNRRQKKVIVHKVHRRFGEDLRGRCFGLWGLSFKPATDDVRAAPSLEIVQGLVASGARIKAHDPVALATAGKELRERGVGERIELLEQAYDACAGVDALIIVTEWNQYRNPDFLRMRQLMKQPIVFDGRNLFRPTLMAELGFEHYAIGRPAVGPAKQAAGDFHAATERRAVPAAPDDRRPSAARACAAGEAPTGAGQPEIVLASREE